MAATDVRLVLGAAENEAFSGQPTLYFRVEDIQAAVESLAARGVEFGEAPHVVHRTESHALWICFTRDPDGNNIALMSEVPIATS